MRYISKLFSTGAVRKTPSHVIQVLVAEAATKNRNRIVEIGAGGGELTKALMKSVSWSEYNAIEISKEACSQLHKNFPTVSIHCTSAFTYVQSLSLTYKIDLFVSSIPMSFYSHREIVELLQKVRSSMAPDGKIVIIFTAFWLIPLFKRQFKGVIIRPFVTFPPYFIMIYEAV